MFKQMGGHFHNDNKTREDLIENIEIGNINNNDIDSMIESVSPLFGLEPSDLREQLMVTGFDMSNSIKVYDKRDNKIYGVLLFSKYNVVNGTPILSIAEKKDLFENKRGINGFMFAIDKRLRGTNIDKEMLRYSIPFLQQYEYIWVGVGINYNTHNYWKRLGFIPFLNIPEAIFYYMTIEKIINKYL